MASFVTGALQACGIDLPCTKTYKMNQIIQLNQQDLRSEIRSCILESLEEIKNLPSHQERELPDHCDFNEACELVGYSKSKMYKETAKGTVPYKKYGKKLIFNREELQEWKKSRTKNCASEIMAGRIANQLSRRNER